MTKLERRLLDALSLGALTALAGIVFLHIYYLDKQLEKSAYRIVALLSDSPLILKMKQLEAALSARMIGLDSDNTAITSTPIHLGSEDLPSRSLASCEPDQVGSEIVLLRCATLVTRINARPVDTAAALVFARAAGLGAVLHDLYVTSYGSIRRRDHTSKSQAAIAFVYVLFPIGDTEAVVTYPGIRVGSTFDFTKRPWYRSPRRITDTDLFASPIYHDYASNDFVVTVSLHDISMARPIRVFADYRVQQAITGVDLYLLNGLIVLIALTGYIRFYSRSHRVFQKFLVASALSLFVAYTCLVTNQILAILGARVPALSDRILVTQILTFLPTGSLLAVAALSLKGAKRSPWGLVGIWYIFEALSAVATIRWNSPLFTAAFSCVCLLLFGRNLWLTGLAYKASDFDDLNPHPRRVAGLGSLAYCFWGLAQFSLIFLVRESSPLPAVLSSLMVRVTWLNVFCSDVGGFIVLLYAKGVAIFYTTLFLYSLELIEMRRSLRDGDPPPSLVLNGGGRILNYLDFPSTFDQALDHRRFADMLADDEDRKEFTFAFGNDIPLSAYLCRVRNLFDGSLLSINLASADGVSHYRRVWLRPLDLSRLQATVEKDACEQLVMYIEELHTKIDEAARHLSEGSTPVEATSLLASLRSLFSSTGRKVLDRSRRELMTLAGEKLVSEVKLPTRRLWEVLVEETTRFTNLLIGSGITVTRSDPEVALASSPGRARVSEGIWRLAVSAVLEEFADSVATSLEDNGSREISIEVIPPDQVALPMEGLVVVVFGMRVNQHLRDAATGMRKHLIHLDPHRAQPGRRLYSAQRLLAIFDGELEPYIEHERMCLKMGVRPLYSSRATI